MNLGNISREDAYRRGQDDCAKTHFKPGWQVNAKMLKEAVDETRTVTAKEERQNVARWMEGACTAKKHDMIGYRRIDCWACRKDIIANNLQGHAPTESGEWPE